MALIDAGLADHILISGDASRGYARPITSFVPKLKAAGAKDDVLHRITELQETLTVLDRKIATYAGACRAPERTGT